MAISSNTMLHKGLLDMQNLDADSADDPTAEGAMYFSGSSTSGDGTARFNFNSGVKAPKLKIGSGAEVTTILDEDNLGSDSAAALATQQSIKAYVDAQVTAQDLDVTADSGTLDIDLDSESFSIVGATGLGTSATGTTLTVGISAGGVGTTQLADNGVTLGKMAGLARGKFIYGDASGDPAALALGSAHQFLQSDGTDLAWVSMSGDVALAAGVATIQANAVEGSMLNNNAISGQTALASGVAATDELLLSDDGTLKKIDVSLIGDFVGSSADFDVTSGALSLANNSVGTNEIENVSVTTAKIAADAIDGTKLADDAVNSEHYTDGSVDNVHLANSAITIAGASTALGSSVSAATIAAAIDGEDMALTSLTDLDVKAAGNITILDTVGASTLTIGAGSTTVAIAGGLSVAGTTTTFDSTTVSIADPIFELGASGADDNLDRGVIMKYNNGGAKKAFMGYDDSDGKFKLIADATDTSSVISGTPGTLAVTLLEGNVTGNVNGNCSGTAATVTGAAQSAITSVGTLTALQVDNLNVNGNTLSATSGAITVTAAAGSAVAVEGVSFDGGVVSGASSISATALAGELTGNASTSTKIASITNSNIVQLTETQTLTNKTLTSPDINTPDIDGGTIDDVTLGGTLAGTPNFSGIATHAAKEVFNAGLSVKNGATSSGMVSFYEDSDNGTSQLALGGPMALAGDCSIMMPDPGNGASDTMAVVTLAQTLANKTLASSCVVPAATLTAGTLGAGNYALVGQFSSTTGSFGSVVVSGASMQDGNYAVDVANTNNSTGRVRANAFVTYSERALKSEIKDLTNPMAKLNALRPVTYNWKASDTKASGWKSEEIGFIADEVQQVVPQIVATTPDGYAQGIDYSKLTALLTQAVKVQDTEIKDLKAQLSKVLKALELKG